MLGKVEICGVNTAELKVLSSDACRALLIRAKHGDRDAREHRRDRGDCQAPALAHAPDAVAACGFGLTHIFSSGSTGWIEISMKQVYNSIDAAF